MKYAKPFALSLCLFLAIVLSACGDDGGSGPSGSEATLSSSSEGESGDGSSIGSSSDDDGYSSDEDDFDGGRSSKKKSSSSSSSTSSSSADEGPQSPLGACAASNDGEVKQDADGLVGEPGVRYACDAGLGAWREATVLEYDTYLWGAAEDGLVQKGLVTDAIYKYDSLQGAWRKANANDTALHLGGCTQGRERKVDLAATDYYICRNGKWGFANVREYNTYGLQCDGNSVLVHGLVVDSLLYVCDADTFRDATVSEKLADLGCTSYNAGDSVLFKGYARCAGGGRWIAARTTVPDTLIDPRDGHAYKTVGIGLQRWMAENLDYADSVAMPSLVGRSWCYNDSAEYCARYGRLYTWAAAMDSATTKCGNGKVCAASDSTVRGVCPAGWHLPAKEEFTLLFNAVGDSATAGSALKSAEMSGEDAYGFSALAGGQRDYRRGFVEVGAFAYFWTKNGYGRDETYVELMRSDYANVPALRNSKSSGYSVRCVED